MRIAIQMAAATFFVTIAVPVGAQPPAKNFKVTWKKIVVDKLFRSEGVGVVDVNKDGKKDIPPAKPWDDDDLQQLVREMALKYKPDGYWLDFIDGIPSICVAPHQHDIETFGQGLQLSLEAVRSAIQDTTPGAVVQFRANYANLHNKAYANVWQAEDSPGDFVLALVLGNQVPRPGVLLVGRQIFTPVREGIRLVAQPRNGVEELLR